MENKKNAKPGGGCPVTIDNPDLTNPQATDAVAYLKRFGHHLLAVKVVMYRKGQAKLDDFASDLMDAVVENGDHLVGGGYG